MTGLEQLVGIPWGRGAPPAEADCLTLAVYAQHLLWGRVIPLDMDIDWTESDLRERSREIVVHVARWFRPANTARPGDIATVSTCGYLHLVTVVAPHRMLHTAIGGKSRISRMRSSGKMRIWRYKEEAV